MFKCSQRILWRVPSAYVGPPVLYHNQSERAAYNSTMEAIQGCVLLGRMSTELVKHQRRLTERKGINQQGTREGCFAQELYHFLTNFDYSVVDILDFVTILEG